MVDWPNLIGLGFWPSAILIGLFVSYVVSLNQLLEQEVEYAVDACYFDFFLISFAFV